LLKIEPVTEQVRNLLSECDCPSPFRATARSASVGDCFGKGAKTALPEGGKARTLAIVDLARAKVVLSAFDLVLTTEQLDHPALPSFALWRLGVVGPCSSPAARPAGTAVGGTALGGGLVGSPLETPLAMRHLHASAADMKSRAEDVRRVPSCVRQALEEQSRLEAELYRWAERRLQLQLMAFDELRIKAC
jgi:hypothetical protein